MIVVSCSLFNHILHGCFNIHRLVHYNDVTWVSWCLHHILCVGCNKLSILWLKLIHVSKGSPGFVVDLLLSVQEHSMAVLQLLIILSIPCLPEHTQWPLLGFTIIWWSIKGFRHVSPNGYSVVLQRLMNSRKIKSHNLENTLTYILQSSIIVNTVHSYIICHD